MYLSFTIVIKTNIEKKSGEPHGLVTLHYSFHGKNLADTDLSQRDKREERGITVRALREGDGILGRGGTKQGEVGSLFLSCPLIEAVRA